MIEETIHHFLGSHAQTQRRFSQPLLLLGFELYRHKQRLGRSRTQVNPFPMKLVARLGDNTCMENQAFTLEDIQKLYAMTLATAVNAPAKMLPAFGEFIQGAYAHYESMTPEAIAFLEGRQEAMVGLLNHVNSQLPDGIEKRKMKRMLTSVSSNHLQAAKLVTNFPILRDAEPLIENGHGVFVKALQRLLDFMHDISLKSHNGPASFAKINLLYWAVDELTAANFLARRGYTTLTYTHLRSVIEIADKIELFDSKPEMADVWASGGPEHEIWRKLSPLKVRQMLGKDNKDPIYAHFSHQGAHPTYTAAQMRMTRKDQAGETLKVGIGVGGKRNPAEQAALMGYCVMLTNLCTMRASLSFPEDLNTEESTQ
jgi:hypothetical protein